MPSSSNRSGDGIEIPEDATTVERALMVVGDILVHGGEHSLRLNDVSERSGVSIGSLYHYFGSREGLVNAAREWIFERSVPQEFAASFNSLARVETHEEFLDQFEAITAEAFTEERANMRRWRLQMLGATVAAPEQMPRIVAAYGAMVDALQEVVSVAQDRGWIVKDIDSRAFATFLFAESLAPAFGELDGVPQGEQAWRVVLREVLTGVAPQQREGDE